MVRSRPSGRVTVWAASPTASFAFPRVRFACCFASHSMIPKAVPPRSQQHGITRRGIRLPKRSRASQRSPGPQRLLRSTPLRQRAGGQGGPASAPTARPADVRSAGRACYRYAWRATRCSGGEQPLEERTVALQRHAELLSVYLVAPAPLTLQFAPLIGEHLCDPLDDRCNEVVRLLDRLARFIHKARLNTFPAGAIGSGLLRRNEGR